jgi:hypothetical protein
VVGSSAALPVLHSKFLPYAQRKFAEVFSQQALDTAALSASNGMHMRTSPPIECLISIVLDESALPVDEAPLKAFADAHNLRWLGAFTVTSLRESRQSLMAILSAL